MANFGTPPPPRLYTTYKDVRSNRAFLFAVIKCSKLGGGGGKALTMTMTPWNLTQWVKFQVNGQMVNGQMVNGQKI